VRRLLAGHPKIGRVGESGESGIQFDLGGWRRAVLDGDPSAELKGLVELVDNNPLVCSDRFATPDPVSTLALISIGPLAQAGILAEAPTILTNAAQNGTAVEAFLETVGWQGGVDTHYEPEDLGGALAATVMCAIRTPEELSEIDDLFDERYSKSFYVRRDEDSEWHVSLALGKPFALYRLRISPGDSQSLLTVQVMADRQGKCGAAQMIHAMNVMCGFEESLGIG
jgi:N-acetyl-gamma-glutamylphosphate reductase